MKDLNSGEILSTLFTHLGFSDKEVKIYTVLLEKGQATAGEIITASGLKRGITYAILYELEEKGLIKVSKSEKKTVFELENPQALLDLLDIRKKEVESVENSLKYYIPQLVSQYKLAIGKPTVRYYEGQQGLEKAFEDIHHYRDNNVYGIVDIEKLEAALPGHSHQEDLPLRIKNNITSYALFGDSPEARKFHAQDEKHNRVSILINKETYPSPAEIDIYGDKIAMFSFKPGQLVSVVIENEDFAETLRSVFKYIFDHQNKDKKKS